MKKIKVIYWSPFISKIATVKAVLDSAISLKKYSNDLFKPEILNVFGEFNDYKKKNLFIRDLSKISISNFLSDKGYFSSRLSFIIIAIYSFFPLLNFLKKEKPDYLIIHLITIVPLLINYFFKIDTKIILRISGLPKITGLRKFMWKFLLSKIFFITCPTKQTKQYLIDNKIINKNKIFLLSDPILNINKSRMKLKENFPKNYGNYIFSAGRLTKQKNFSFLIKSFSIISKKFKNLNLIIAGDGEEYLKLISIIKKYKLEEKVKLIGYTKNVFHYMKNSYCFIMPSLWEDPGFVLVEAIFSRCPVISSNCPNGPQEILSRGKGGYLFQSNDVNSLIKIFDNFVYERNNRTNELKWKKNTAFKNIKKFTLFNHYMNLSKLILINDSVKNSEKS